MLSNSSLRPLLVTDSTIVELLKFCSTREYVNFFLYISTSFTKFGGILKIINIAGGLNKNQLSPPNLCKVIILV